MHSLTMHSLTLTQTIMLLATVKAPTSAPTCTRSLTPEHRHTHEHTSVST